MKGQESTTELIALTREEIDKSDYTSKSKWYSVARGLEVYTSQRKKVDCVISSGFAVNE